MSNPTITIDLLEHPRNGTAQIVFRCEPADRAIIARAAKLVGMSASKFMRTVLIQASYQIQAEAALAKVEMSVGGELLKLNPLRPPGATKTVVK